MVRISRYILVIVTILAGAVALPKLYWTIMEKPVFAPFVRYSIVEKAFMIMRPGATALRQDSRGKSYTREEYEQRLPMMYYMQLATNGTLPDSINGVEMDMHTIRKASSSYRFQSKYMDSPQPGLYPMFESESGRVNLEMPNDFFRIRNSLEFIDTKTNKVLAEKSTLFTDALTKKGFNFPAGIIAGLPTTKKSCDEGYFVTDANFGLFHVKMEKGKPYIRKVNLPDGLSFKWIECVDFANKLFYAYLISKENDIYVVMQDTYELKKLPVSGFTPEVDDLKIYGDLFHYNVIIEGERYVMNYALDNKFNPVDKYEEKWHDRYQRNEGKIFAFLFPFELSMKSEKSLFVDFRFNRTDGFSFIFFGLLLAALQVWLIRRQNNQLKHAVADLILIIVSGIFGFIAVNIFRNKVYK